MKAGAASPNGWRSTKPLRLNLPDDIAAAVEAMPPYMKTALVIAGYAFSEEYQEHFRKLVEAIRDNRGEETTRK